MHAGLYRRAELESEVAGPQPDFTRIRNGDLADVLASPQVRAQLRPVFVTDFSRSRRLLELGPEVTVEAAIDCGEIKGGGRLETAERARARAEEGHRRAPVRSRARSC